MGHKYSVSYKIKKFRKDFVYFSLAFQHLIRYICKIYNLIRKFFFGINKRRISVYYFAVLYFNRTDFNYLALFFVKSGCLNVEYDIFIIKGLSLCTCNNFTKVINKIGLNAIYYFDAVCLSRIHGLRISLYNSVVCNRNGFMSPLGSPFNVCFHTCNSVHGTHSRMEMKLNTFFLACIHTYRRSFSLYDIP